LHPGVDGVPTIKLDQTTVSTTTLNGHSIVGDSSQSGALRARQRILDAALRLVSEGGYDALQVRAIAEQARVSSRTIYEHFGSLDAVLIVAVANQNDGFLCRYTRSSPTGDTPSARVNQLIRELTDMLTANDTLAVALLRAFLSGKADVAPYVQRFRAGLTKIVTSAIAPEYPTVTDRAVAGTLEHVWFAALVGWASGTDRDAHTVQVMRCATRLLLPTDPNAGSEKQGLGVSGSG